ncbi:MAG: DUF4197 domain-containing protein [Gammaproteobacteria bacterium]|nr:DUF4197 domain-containing protein [Gammaproteobacteria bacterium]
MSIAFVPARRALAVLLLILPVAFWSVAAHAGSLDALSSREASGGLRAALGRGIDQAVAHLGVPGGFLSNPKVRIPLPPALRKIDRGLRLVGMGGDADALDVAMNHAAESAVADAKPILEQALRHMTIDDAKGILTGGDDSVTQYFRRTTGDSLRRKFEPIVATATARVRLATLYDQYAGNAARFGLVKADDAHLNDYVTRKALDGLFSAIADEERAIRRDPLHQGSSLIKRVFGALNNQ